jgi:hypothetical protein
MKRLGSSELCRALSLKLHTRAPRSGTPRGRRSLEGLNEALAGAIPAIDSSVWGLDVGASIALGALIDGIIGALQEAEVSLGIVVLIVQ